MEMNTGGDVSLAMDLKARQGRRRALSGVNTVAAILLAGVLLVMVNYLSFRHYARTDISRSGYYSLSGKTQSLLAGVTSRVDIIVFFQPDHPAYEDIDNLLKEYEYASTLVHVERLDPNRNLARTEELARKYDVSKLNVVVFDCGGRTKFMDEEDIFEMDYSPVPQGGAPVPEAFKGEQAFSSAILSVTEGRKPVVYFLSGHGERDPENRDPNNGYSHIRQEIVRDNLEVRTFTFGREQAVPRDADALVIAGPKKRFAQAELDLIDQYLEHNGRLLVLLDARVSTGLELWMEKWDVGAGDDMVVDPKHTLSGYEVFIDEYEKHPITRDLKNTTCVFHLPRSVYALTEKGADDLADKPVITVLCKSSADSWGETDFEQKPMRYDKGVDFAGPVSIAVALERGPIEQVDVDLRPSRMVVFGDSDFISNAPLTGGNYDLFMNALNWLLEREDLLAISAKSPVETRLVMDSAQLVLLLWVVAVGLPALVGSVGLVVWMKRRF